MKKGGGCLFNLLALETMSFLPQIKMMNKNSNLFLQGTRDIIPLLIAAAPFGIVYGALAQANGLSVFATMGMSLFVFAGSSQFVAATLIGAGATVPIIILTVFVVNLRHMLYAVSMMPYVSELPQKIRALMSFWKVIKRFPVLSERPSTRLTAFFVHKHVKN